jgi:hypothetical protein
MKNTLTWKKNKVNKNFNVAVLHKNFFELNKSKNFDTYTISVYMYLIHELNINFYENPLHLSIRKISQNLNINYKTVLSRIEILKNNNLIFFENKKNKTFFYFDFLAKQKINLDNTKSQKIKFESTENLSTGFDFLYNNISKNLYTDFKNYVVDIPILINEETKEVVLITNNKFLYEAIKRKFINKIRSELKDYKVELKSLGKSL